MASVLLAEVVKLLQKLSLPPLCDTEVLSNEWEKSKEVLGALFSASSRLPLAVLHDVLGTAPRDLGILCLNTKKHNREVIIETLPSKLFILITHAISLPITRRLPMTSETHRSPAHHVYPPATWGLLPLHQCEMKDSWCLEEFGVEDESLKKKYIYLIKIILLFNLIKKNINKRWEADHGLSF